MMARRAKISYMVVLLAMIMFMGTRIVPHHHCATSSETLLQTVHFGYGDCEGCEHSHNNEHNCGHDDAHSHSEAHCYSDSQFFLRVCDNDSFVVQKTLAFQPAKLLPELFKVCVPNVQSVWCHAAETPPSIRVLPFRLLRAPPVA